MVKVSLKGEVREFENGITVADIAKSVLAWACIRLPAPVRLTMRW